MTDVRSESIFTFKHFLWSLDLQSVQIGLLSRCNAMSFPMRFISLCRTQTEWWSISVRYVPVKFHIYMNNITQSGRDNRLAGTLVLINTWIKVENLKQQYEHKPPSSVHKFMCNVWTEHGEHISLECATWSRLYKQGIRQVEKGCSEVYISKSLIDDGSYSQIQSESHTTERKVIVEICTATRPITIKQYYDEGELIVCEKTFCNISFQVIKSPELLKYEGEVTEYIYVNIWMLYRL